MLSIRWRLTLHNAISLLVISVLLLVAIFGVLGVGVQDIVENSTRNRVNQAARILATTGSFEELESKDGTRDDIALVAFDGSGTVVYRNGREDSILEGYPGALAFDTLHNVPSTDVELGFDSQAYLGDPALRAALGESYVYAVPLPPNDLGVTVVAGTRSYDTVGGDRFGLWVVGGGGGLLVLLAIIVLVSYLITKAALKPINALAATANAMSDSDLSRRLPVGGNKRNEFDRLANTFNGLLGRLQSAFRDREIALDEQRQFVQDASHELRTPLTSILGYTRMLNTLGLDNPAASREAVVAIEREAERMHGLVKRLLTLAQVDTDAYLNQRSVDIRDVISAAITSIRSAGGDTIDIAANLPNEPVRILIEPDLIAQALVILFDNAVKFSAPSSRVDVRLTHTSDDLAIAVQDTGIGIGEVDIPRIFDRFYRTATSRSKPGTGLGLAIARQIAERHGGRIQVSSIPTRGSTFTVEIPMHPAKTGDPVIKDVPASIVPNTPCD